MSNQREHDLAEGPELGHGADRLGPSGYQIHPCWADLSGVPGIATSWAHGGVVVAGTGELLGFHAGKLVAFDVQGTPQRVVSSELTEGHGLTLVNDDDREALWVCDPGFLFRQTHGQGEEGLAAMFGAGLETVQREPRVVKMTLDGRVLLELPVPPADDIHPAGPFGSYCPCGTAVAEERFGGTGDIWVADGYGSSLVHRFDKRGNHLMALSGEEGAGHFACPHAVYIDRRAGKLPELYVADRSNRRVQIYDLEGHYRRTVGADFLNSPSGFAQWGDLLVVAELFGRLAALDFDDHLVGYIGVDPDCHAEQGWPDRPGWPNELAPDGRAVRPELHHSGWFNSPHSLAVDGVGNLFVSEWVIGGRYNKVTSDDRRAQRES